MVIMEIFKAQFDMVLKISTNEIYSGCHFRTRMKHKQAFKYEVIRVVRKMKIKPVDTYPVSLNFSFYFEKTLLDSSNCSYMAKMIEDALVKEGVLKNDSPQYVFEVSNKSMKGPNIIVLEVSHVQGSNDKRSSSTVHKLPLS